VSKVIDHLLPTLAGELAQRRAESVIDPHEDLALRAPVGPLPFGSDVDAVELWSERWPDEPTPALGGSSPRAAARRQRDRPIVEALLRTLEHDADILAHHGQPVPDFARLRAELRMERWWE
jgi:hypothetical protein